MVASANLLIPGETILLQILVGKKKNENDRAIPKASQQQVKILFLKFHVIIICKNPL